MRHGGATCGAAARLRRRRPWEGHLATAAGREPQATCRTYWPQLSRRAQMGTTRGTTTGAADGAAETHTAVSW